MTKTVSVLVVDDNVDLAEDVQEILEDDGVDVDVAANGAVALEKLDARTYDLVLTDMKMPEIGGLELVQRIKARAPETPVLLMTAFADPDTLEAAHTAGALACLPKPLDFNRLIAVVARIVGGHRRVLLLDDDRDLRTSLTEALLEEGTLLPCPAPDLETAKRLAQRLEFSAAVLDLRLPDGSGLEVARSLRSDSEDPVRVVVCSGYLAEDQPDCTPCALQLSKPVNPGLLIEEIRKLQA